jgi:uncharacterized protein (TIGR03435 family)
MTGISMLLKVTLVLGIAAVIQIAFARRISAATRHLIWTLTIASLLLLPVLAMSLPDWTPVEYAEPAGLAPVLGGVPADLPVVSVSLAAGRAPGRPDPPAVLATIYLAGVIVLLTRVLLQHLWARRIVRAATPITGGPWQQLLDDCMKRIGVQRSVTLLQTDSGAMPAATGIWRASVMLPAAADSWPDDRRRAVLLHELAHVERHDCLIQTLAAVACAVYWVHPAVWWVASRLHAERERACDDRVLAAGQDARDYAEHLLELACTLGHHAAPAVAVTMARPRELEGRMLAVLDAARNRAVPALRNRLAGAAVLVGLTIPVAAATLTPRFHVLNGNELRLAMADGRVQTDATRDQRLAFDVASIKRTDPNDPRPGADFGIRPGGQLIARNNEVANFIGNSYGIPGYTIIGGPAWMREERYDLMAKADRERPAAEMMQMLRTLLADRFQFRAHRETREIPAYVLTVARGGAKLTRTKDGDCIVRDPDRPTPPPALLATGDVRRPGCGNNNITSRDVAPNMMWRAVGVDSASIASALAAYFRRPVVDRTRLTGRFTVEQLLPPLQPVTTSDGAAVDTAPSVFTVLQEQLGLRVEEGRGPVDVLVVDRIERPTEN